jgi:hypothetical protein
MSDRKSLSNNQIVDIQYSKFIKNPLGHIKDIYIQLNLGMSIATENKIQDYLLKDKQITKSSHNYSLSEYGLNEEIIKNEFRDYMLNYDF